ncbi:MAG: hypothetical protein KDC71_16070, partial [Acidobacteria bacterium]|nr:hypothetical protein [Acidobacteriota bacterium]
MMCRSGLLLLALLAPLRAQQHGEGEDPFRLSDAPIPLTQSMPARPIPPLEWGEPFKGTGPIRPGYRLPSGAVWQPQFILFGAARFGLLSSETAQGRVDEWANRLDVFGNLQLTGSERIVVGLRNLDQAGTFSGYVFNSEVPSLDEGKQDGLNADLQTLFFEGDFGELFPNLSPRDFRPTDWGFALGRQNLFFQEGLLVDDVVDGIGITRNSLQPKGTSNLRLTFFYGWGNIDRPASGSAENLLAVFSSM